MTAHMITHHCSFCQERDATYLGSNIRGYPVYHCRKCNRIYSRPDQGQWVWKPKGGRPPREVMA